MGGQRARSTRGRVEMSDETGENNGNLTAYVHMLHTTTLEGK